MTDPQPDVQTAPTCWWHPDRPTGLRCTRCERSACPECLREASVGYQCIDCVAAAQREHKARAAAVRRTPGFGFRTVAGARVTGQAVVTPVLIALNLLVFVVTVAQSQSMMDNSASPLFADLALWPPAVAAGEWWRLVGSGFLHFGPLHLLMNMVALWFLGRDLEMLLGRARYIGLYALSLLGGGAAVYMWSEVGSLTAGASGAVYGLLGGILVAAIRLRLNLSFILIIIGLNLFLSFRVPGISWLGHLGGMAVGLIVTAALVYPPERIRIPVQVGTMVAMAVALVTLILVRDAQFVAMF